MWDQLPGLGAIFGGIFVLLFYSLFELAAYYLWEKRNQEEYSAYKEQAKREAREKLLKDFQKYKEDFRLFRGDVEVELIRNTQRKYEFEVHLKTANGTFPFENMYGSLSQYDNKNRELKWDIEKNMPDKHEDESFFVNKFQEVLKILLDDRRKLEDLKSEIRPFVEHPI